VLLLWLGRLAARRVVWIVVGLAVYALLGAAGVRAADPSPDPSLLPQLVSLVDVDRARLDGLFELLKYATALVAFFGSALLVSRLRP
jgi:hypothetical protein